MSLISCIDSINPATTTISMDTKLNTYIITASANTTYNYNLPSITCDGQEFRLIRSDSTNATINLNGNLNINGTIVSTYVISSFTTITVMSLGIYWYVIQTSTNTITGNNNIFSGFFIGNNGDPYIQIANGSTFLLVPFVGTSNGAILSNVVITMGFVNPGISAFVEFRNIVGTVLFTVNVVGVTTNYVLTASERAALPTGNDVITATLTSVNTGNFPLSSIIFYS